MLRSYSNILVSVRRVTQVNKGKNTAGVDKVVVKTPKARGRLVDELTTHTPWKAKPVRRIYILKRSGKQRPLGIPVIKDRCLQAMVKNALEPEWEAKFESISYGFRPGRSCHDAIEKIYSFARPNKKKKWVVDADIKGAFDNIDHTFLLLAIGSFPAKELIKQWLKAGYMENLQLFETHIGTPQGGVISPLLANIALHGMEEALTVRRTTKNGKTIVTFKGVKYDSRGFSVGKRAVVRYADDFVCFCESKEDAQKSVRILQEWLSKRGLTLSKEKTKIVHLTEGFDFLGFNVRHYRAEKTSKTKWKLLIKPSKESVQRIKDKLKEQWLSMKGKSVKTAIKTLNPIIRGWANYFRTSVAKEILHSLDRFQFRREVRYVKHTHPNKPRYWTDAKYWGKLNPQRKDRWVFGDKESGMYILKFSWFPIERHTLVFGAASPDDASLREYWHERNLAKSKNLKSQKQKIAKRQNGRCLICNESLLNGEEIHIHHRKPKEESGESDLSNLQLVHLYCHQQIHK